MLFKPFSILYSLVLILWISLGCDNRHNSYVIDGNTNPANPIIGTLPNPGAGGGGGGTCTPLVTFSPASPLTVTAGDPATIVTATVSPLGGILTITNITDGGTGLIVTPGPGADEITVDPSSATASGTASIDATYDASNVNPNCSAVNVTYIVNVLAAPVLTRSFTTGPITVAIPDGLGEGTPGLPAVSTIDTNAGGTVTVSSIIDVRIALNVTHTFRDDLGMTLSSPSFTTITLVAVSGIGGAIDDFRVIFDDTAASISSYTTAAVSVAAPFSSYPSFAPVSALSNFSTQDANGVWTLSITDASPYDTGTLNEWAIAFDGDSAIF